ncbi:hypothetical protein ABT009_35845 [Streptomyces sp. NPDC002896]|uniref:hypothetical protein n=1 Tax=Streptomyces sp. NPDC002896 TaxID=3154438 RepID=UPI0033321CDF
MVVQQHRRRGTVFAAAAAAMGLVSGATGCSGSGAAADSQHPADPVDAMRQAADILVQQGTSKARTSMEMATGGTRVTIRGEGVYDYRARLGRLKVVLPQDPAGVDKHRPITELLAPGALYMKNRGAGVPADKWVRVDTTTLSDGNLVTGGATDPLAAAELLRGAQDVKYVGESEVAGTPVRHYRGTAVLERAAKRASAGHRAALKAAAKGFPKGEVPFDAYLDDQGRVRKVRHQFSFANNRGEGGKKSDVDVASTTLLYDFGAPVRVELPDAEDIFAGKIAEE